MNTLGVCPDFTSKEEFIPLSKSNELYTKINNDELKFTNFKLINKIHCIDNEQMINPFVKPGKMSNLSTFLETTGNRDNKIDAQ